MERQAEIIEFLKQGKTYDEIAEALKVSTKTISKVKRESGLSFPRGKKVSTYDDTPIEVEKDQSRAREEYKLAHPDIYSAMDTSKEVYTSTRVGERVRAIKESLQYIVNLAQKKTRKHPELHKANLTHLANVQELLNFIDMTELHGE